MPVPVDIFIPVDTCILINFLRIDRMDLIGGYPGSFIVTEDVDKEIVYPEHLENMNPRHLENEAMERYKEKRERYRENTKRYEQALSDCHLFRKDLTNEETTIQGEISIGMHITSREVRVHEGTLTKPVLGAGERSIIALALNRNYTSLATDDQNAIKFVNRINDIFNEVPNARKQVDILDTHRKQIDVLDTPRIMIELIRRGTLTVEDANEILADLGKNHRFKSKIESFRKPS